LNKNIIKILGTKFNIKINESKILRVEIEKKSIRKQIKKQKITKKMMIKFDIKIK
jgi:hypothetical protein